MLKYIFSIWLLLLCSMVSAQTDTTVIVNTDTVKRVAIPQDTLLQREMVDSIRIMPGSDTIKNRKNDVPDSLHQLRIGLNVAGILINSLTKDSQSTKKSLEFELDYYYKKSLYLVAEFGWGNASVDYPDLKYSSNNIFLKLGANKSILFRRSQTDWDMAFVGLRYAMSVINRSEASYMATDPFWGSQAGTIPGRNIFSHWFEITAGTRIELYRGIFMGWNIRTRFRLNKKPFEELPPYYIGGYGKGDKNFVFDFNFYLSYAIRWRR